MKTARPLLQKQHETNHQEQTRFTWKSRMRIPHQRPFASAITRRRRAAQVVRERWSTEVHQAGTVSSHFSPQVSTEQSLKSKQIHAYSFKKTKEILRKIHERFTKERGQASLRRLLARFSSSELPQQNAADELWKEMIKPHEERQFQVGHLVRFLS